MQPENWRLRLRAARKLLGLNQQQVAAHAGLSAEAVRGYENGRRTPRRENFVAVLDALRLNHVERRELMEQAGFAPEDRGARNENSLPQWYNAEEAVAVTERFRWPAFVLDEFARVVGANEAAQRLWGVDLRYEFLDPVERNLLSVASDPRFASRCLNWDEAIGIILSVFKAHDWAPERMEAPGPYFSAVMEHFLKGDPKYVARFTELWQQTPDVWQKKARWTYPIVWEQPGIGTLRFEALTSSASDIEGLAFNDWIPLDAATWEALDRVHALPKRRPRR
jgi:transcriptional regulator with XRE-family HTH domain